MHTLTTLVASLPTAERDTIAPASETVRAGVLLVAPLLVGLPLLSAAVLLLAGPPLGPVGALARRARLGGLVRRRPRSCSSTMLQRSEDSRVIDVSPGHLDRRGRVPAGRRACGWTRCR